MSLLKSAATVGGLTMASRALGFVRDQLVAFAVGTGPVGQAFVVAQRFPNLFRALFAEGAFNNAFVPLFAKRVEAEGPENARAFAVEVFSVLLAWLVVFCAAAMVAMPFIMMAIAPGFDTAGPKYDLAVSLTRICFPYLLFMSLAALMGGVLNSIGRFTAAAAAPILLNLVMIAANIVVWRFDTGNTPLTGRIFAWGVFAAGVAQFALLAAACKRAGMPMVPKMPKLSPDVWRVIKLSAPGIVSGGIMQINLVIATMIATTIDRAVSYLYYADRVYQLPLGVIAVAIGVVLLPDLSRKLRADDAPGAVNSQNRALELSLFLTLPAAIALIAIPAPVMHTLFEHGEFTREDSLMTALAVSAFACGLPAFTMTKVFQPGYFAREDTRTPMVFAGVSVAVNIAASLLLSRFFGHAGIAIATALAAWTNAAQLGLTLQRRGHYAPDARLRSRLPRIIAASLIMGAALLALRWLLSGAYEPGTGFAVRGAALLALVFGGVAVYFAAAFALRAVTPAELKSMVRRA
jgi:putative peptidoglycan lipid II flippase